ncbi:MAG TPA: hypothetical protein VKY82_07200 [Flavobacterium sp.]|nr:hypothetical protein [Flavobacterium sp.]
MIELNLKISFIYGWGSLRNIRVYVDDQLHSKLLAQGEYVIELPKNTQKITFKLGMIFPYETSIFVTAKNRADKELFAGLYLHHRGLVQALYDSLKTDYLRSIKLNPQEYTSFQTDIYRPEFIVLENNKTSILTLLVSLIILLFSIIQQENELAPLAFMIGLSSSITSLVYFNERKVGKITYKSRMIATVILFVLAVLFLENSFHFLHGIILMFTILLSFLIVKNLKNKEVLVHTEEL